MKHISVLKVVSSTILFASLLSTSALAEDCYFICGGNMHDTKSTCRANHESCIAAGNYTEFAYITCGQELNSCTNNATSGFSDCVRTCEARNSDSSYGNGGHIIDNGGTNFPGISGEFGDGRDFPCG